MNIQQKLTKIKPVHMFIASGALGACLGYGIGVFYPPPRPPPGLVTGYIEDSRELVPVSSKAPVEEGIQDQGSSTVPVYRSKSGTKYYFPWCSGLASIKKENLQTFPSEIEAINLGYEKAKSCSSKDPKEGEK
jgi:hypothetical protein